MNSILSIFGGATTNNDLEPLKTWLAAGGSPNAQNDKSQSIIEVLAIQHNLEGIKILSPYGTVAR